jgi:hypothetical protein
MGNRNYYSKRLQKPAPVTDEHLRWAVDSVPMGDRVRIVGYHLLDTKNEQPPYRPNPQVLSEAGVETAWVRLPSAAVKVFREVKRRQVHPRSPARLFAKEML